MDDLIDCLVVGFLWLNVSAGLELLIQDVPAMTTLLQAVREHYRSTDSAPGSHRTVYLTASNPYRSFPKRSFTLRSSALLRLGPAELLEEDEATGRVPLPNLYR